MGRREIGVCWASPGARHFVKSRDAVALAAGWGFNGCRYGSRALIISFLMPSLCMRERKLLG